jgi:phosphate transport system protein
MQRSLIRKRPRETTVTKPHFQRPLDTSLRQLREKLLHMGEYVRLMTKNAMTALVTGDRALAEQTIRDDDHVNHEERELDELCLLILARQQPLARDLRLVLLATKMVTDLERIGDLAVNLSERALSLPRGDTEGYVELAHLYALVNDMLSGAIDAFDEADADKAEHVVARDREIDAAYRAAFATLLARMMREPERITAFVELQSAGKSLERIADHAANLAEAVIHLVKGTDVRHVLHPSIPVHNSNGETSE